MQVKEYIVNDLQAGAGARQDLAFCLPVSVNLMHKDRAATVVWTLHLSTVVIVLLTLHGLLCLGIAAAVMVSLMTGLRQQRCLLGFESLRCDQSGQWSLVDGNGDDQWVRLDRLGMAGPYCLVRLKRFGSSVFWISSERHQTRQTWRRLRVLARLL